VLDNMKEEIIALVPVMLLLARRLGYRPVGGRRDEPRSGRRGRGLQPDQPVPGRSPRSSWPQLPLLSASLFRIVFLAAAVGLWIWGTVRYAARTRTAPTTEPDPSGGTLGRPSRRGPHPGARRVRLAGVGVLRFGWGFNEMAALFFALGVVAGLVAGWVWAARRTRSSPDFGPWPTPRCSSGSRGDLRHPRGRAHRGHDRAGLFTPVAQLPLALAALGMMVVHGLVHVPVPSPSGHAVLTLPILVPLADLLGLSRQVTVLAYQYGGGLCELFTPRTGRSWRSSPPRRSATKTGYGSHCRCS